MAQLFGTGTIKSHIDVLSGFDESKISIIQDLYQDYKNGLLTDEVKYKEKFNKVFFGDLLGYEDRTHRIPEGTISGIGNADLIFGNFEDGKENAENIQVVCELKGAKSSLVKKQFGHGGLSPVGQGFAYKTALKNCKWLMVSNFYEIRLYRDNQTDFEEWNLQMLMDPKDNYFNLRKLYLLLHKNNLLSSTGNSKTENLLSHFREEQKEITAKFYKEYKILRVELINDMKQHNPGISSEILIEKAQKIIDRLIFIFFCEDKGLLPDKKLSENILRSREAGFSAWEVTKKFFGLVDKGSEQLGIPNGYNGGLFQKDDVLDSLEIADHICKKFVDLTNYDFDDKLSVNVLGHIFEQSISDLENLKIDLLGIELETEQLADTGKGRRKKDGIFYTPEYIVDYIVQNSVMKYLNEKEDECLLKHKNKKDGEKVAYQEYQHILQNIKVLDPACGSGAFLVRVFDVLFEENKRVGSILNSLFDETETYKNILTNNIYGVDLNAESVEITKLSLRLKSAQKGKKLNNLDGNIKCGNSLIDDPEVAGEKAFDWNVEFKEIMKDGGFDVIVGNPPYVSYYSRQSQSDEYTKDLMAYLIGNYDFIQDKKKLGRFNTVMFFIERAVKLMKNNGSLGFIVDTNLHSNPFYDVRKYITENIRLNKIVDEISVFDGVASSQLILLGSKDGSTKTHKVIRESLDKQTTFVLGSDYQEKINANNSFSLKCPGEEKISEILDLISKNKSIEELLGKNQVRTCITFTGKKEFFVKNTKDNDIDYPLLEGSGGVTGKYSNILYDKYISYDTNLRDSLNKEYLEQAKKENKRSPMVIGLGDLEQFKASKIFVRLSDTKITATFTKDVVCADLSLYIITLDSGKQQDDNFDLLYLLSILNSRLITFYAINKGYIRNLNTGTPQIRLKDIRSIPIKEILLSDQQPFIEKADQMLTLNKDLHELTDKFLHRIQDNLKIEKLTKKLESFYEGDFKDFLAELKKQKVSLSLSQQDEREPYFKEYKEKVLVVKGEIEKTDREIDEMVFELYGLSEEERRVVLNG